MNAAELLALRTALKTVHTYVATPFRPDDPFSVDYDALSENIDHVVNEGVRVIAVGGGTGEVEQLTPQELVGIARTARETVGNRAVLIAALPPNLGEAAILIPEYESIGVDVMLGLSPQIRWQIPRDLDGVAEFFTVLAARTALPLLTYNTQRWPVDFFVRLADIENVIGVKDPCEDEHPFYRAIKQLGTRFVWIGNKRHDPGVIHLRYQMGMQGFSSGFTNFLPKLELSLHRACEAQNWDRAIQIQALLAPLESSRRATDDAAVVKACMDFCGLRGGQVRPPRRNLSEETRKSLWTELDRLVRLLPENDSGYRGGLPVVIAAPRHPMGDAVPSELRPGGQSDH